MSKLLINILQIFYRQFGAAFLCSFLFMAVYIHARKVGWKVYFFEWLANFRHSRHFRRVFALAFYTMMLLLGTLLNRKYWATPLEDVTGDWIIYSNGQFYQEAVQNVLMFIPFTFLLFSAYGRKLCRKKITFLKVCFKSILFSFSCSFFIETSQFLFYLGTFQLSDLVYNTLSGLVGGILYYICYRFKHRR